MRISLTGILLLCCFAVMAQPNQGHRIGVSVISNDQAPVYKATVSLLRNDSSIVAVEVTDASGKAGFRSLPPGQYILRVTNISYTTIVKNVDLANKLSVDETIILQPDATVLNNVSVKKCTLLQYNMLQMTFW